MGPQRALCVDIHGIERGLRGDEQPVALATTETNVGDDLRNGDRADMGAVRSIAVDAAKRRGPHIAVRIAAKAVVGSIPQRREGARVDDGMVGLHVIRHDRAGMPRNVARAGVADIQDALVGREGKPIGLHAIGHDRGEDAGAWVEAVYVRLSDLRRRRVALVFAVDAVGRIAEPNAAVRFHHDIVRRVESLALEMRRQRDDASVMVGAGDPPAPVLARDQPAFAIDGVPVAVARRLAER